ncbi:MAG: phasin family protein [Rhizobiaceae bacterium]|nr:phasin family protein [Rhizobiaceae bacterium]
MFKFDDTNLYGKEAMDNLLKSYSAATKGFQAIATEASDYSKKAYEANVAHFEALMSVRSLEAAVELNTAFAKSAIEGYLAELNKLGEMYSDIAKQTYAPAQAVAAKAVETVKSNAAKAAAA